jgi:hypothetical protein
MNPQEAVRRCEWWGRNNAETQAFGSTADPEVGLYFQSDEFPYEQWTDPKGRQGWAIKIPRYLTEVDEKGEKVTSENPVYRLIEQEIERRKGQV